MIEGYMALLFILELGVIDRLMALLLQANMVTYQSHSMQKQPFCPENWQYSSKLKMTVRQMAPLL